MIKDQFATYEISLKLKELGFNEECLAIYINLVLKPIIQKPISGEFNYKFKSVRNSVIVNSENCSAPLWQQVIDWFRDKHNLDVIISSNLLGYGFIIYNRYPPKNILDNRVFQTYFEAREQAIFKALELIK